MRIACGVDGCRCGWFAVKKDLDTGEITWGTYPTAADLAIEPIPSVIGIDIPIGLPEQGARECDILARKILGRGRASSVFPAPPRAVLEAGTYGEACQARFRIEQEMISRQAWGIVPKVREVDELLRGRPMLQGVFREVHPEVSFTRLAGGKPMQKPKKTVPGSLARRALLEPLYAAAVDEALATRDRRACSSDDVLDAFAVLWTAERIAEGSSISLQSTPPMDGYGLRMEINV
jgi:predicted RNase H-like nuclease